MKALKHTLQHRQHQSRPYTAFGLILIAVISILSGCTFSTSETIEPAANDLRVTPVSTPWTPAATVTPVPSATPDTTGEAADQTSSDTGIVQTTGNQVTYDNAPSVNVENNSSITLNPGFVVNTSPPAPGCGLVPIGAYNVNIRAWPDLNATIVGTLTQGSWVYAQFQGDGWYQIDYTGTPVDGAWIYAKVVNLTQPCSCTPDCVTIPQPPPVQVCTVTNHMAQGVASAPYGDGVSITQLGPNSTSVAVSRLTDGTHYRIQTPGGMGWISVVANVTLYGDCHLLPEEIYNPPPPPVTPDLVVCTVMNHMAHGVMSEPYGNGQPVTQLGPNTTSVALARLANDTHYRIQTPFGTGWISVVANVTLNGDCHNLPVESYDPPPDDGDPLTVTNSAYGFAFDYPANWHVRESGSQVIVTSYDPTNGDPPHAAFADPALVKITIRAAAFAGDHAAWVAQYMDQVNGETLRVFAEQTIALPGGIQAQRLDMVGGTGGFPVLLAVINGNGVFAEGMTASGANFDRVVGTLRAAP